MDGEVAEESLASRESHWDATLWTPELAAIRHESFFVQLRDQLIRSTNKLDILARLPFREIVIPRPEHSAAVLGLGIARQEFHLDPGTPLVRDQWRQTLNMLGAKGWVVDQAEYKHERFAPATAQQPAGSELWFQLHGRHQDKRFILEGTVEAEWGSGDADKTPYPLRLTVRDLNVLERAGVPGFTRHAIMTPAPPQRRFTFVTMPPILVHDLDGDGSDDIALVGINQAFMNDGRASFTSKPFIAEPMYHGARGGTIMADFNGDTNPDVLLVGSQGSWTNQLLLYLGERSIPISAEPLQACPGLRLHSPQALTAGDIDGDGDLDVWLGQYKPPYVGGQLPTPYYDANDGYPSALLRNDGTGNFEDVTVAAGLGDKRFRRTYGASLVDLDDDQDLDLITINDFCGVDLYLNEGDGRFRDVTDRLYNRHLFGMSHVLADFDRDGSLDILAIGMDLPTVRRMEHLGIGRPEFPERTRRRVDMAYGNRLYLRRGDRWIQPDYADQLARSGWTWGCAAADIDNDANVDIYLVNGHISGESVADYDSHYWRHDIYVGSSVPNREVLHYFDAPFRGVNTGKTSWNGYQHNVLFWNAGGDSYVNIAYLMDLAHQTDSRAAVSADLNQDGRMDVLFTDMEWMGNPQTGRTRLRVCLNNLTTDHHWIGVRLNDGPNGRSVVGAKVMARNSDRRFVSQIVLGTSFLSQHPNTVHFGLGTNESLEELTIRWPNGEEQTLQQPAIDRYHVF